MNKKVMALAATGVITLGLAGCGAGGDAGGGTTFRVAFNQEAAHPQAQAVEQLSDDLSDATDGGFSLQLYPDATLGAQEETIEQLQAGTIDFAVVAGSLLENFNSDFSVVNLPYLYDSPEQQMSVLNDDEIMGDLYGSLEEDGIVVVAAYHGGVRNVYSKEGPVETPDDLAGQKIRVIGSDTNVEMMKLMGGVGTPMAQDEVYTAIQSGVIDGGENNELIYSSLSHDEIAPYYSRTQHLMMPDYLIASPAALEKMDDDARAAFDDLAAESVDTEVSAFDEAVEEATTAAEEAGAEFNDVDLDAFRDAVLPMHDELVTSPVQKAVYEAIEAARG
ncbi:MAG: TRAP transporter substrate-binding protein [Microbacterium sp.]